MTVRLHSRFRIAVLRNTLLLFGTIAFAIDPAMSAPLPPVAPASTTDAYTLVQSVRAGARGGRAAVGRAARSCIAGARS